MSLQKANIYEVIEYYKSHTREETEKHFGISSTTVKNYCRRAGFQKHQKLKHNTKRFTGEALSLEECYWLGFLFADGWVRVNQRTGKPTGIGLKLSNVDYHHLLAFKEFMEYEGVISKMKNGNSSLSITMDMDSLLTLGIVPNKTFDGFVPEHALVTEEQRIAWVLGFFDGDGSLPNSPKDNRAIFYCQLKSVLEFVKEVTGSSMSPKVHRKDASYYSLRLRTAETKQFLRKAYSISPVCLPRKLAIFLKKLHS